MLYSGIVSFGKEYHYQIIIGGTYVRFTLLNSYCNTDIERIAAGEPPEHVQLTTGMLMTDKISHLTGYIVSTAQCNKNFKVKAYYGKIGILKKIIENLANSIDMTMICRYDEFKNVDVKTESGFSFEVRQSTNFIDTCRQITGLTYSEIRTQETLDFEHQARRSKVKTWAELVADHDFSWLFDDAGNMKKDYRLITTQGDLDWVKSELIKCTKLVSIDTEDSGLKFYNYPGHPEWRDHIVGMSLSWLLNQGIYIPFESETMECLDAQNTVDQLWPLLEQKLLVAHNGMFDTKVFYTLGKKLKISYDTLLLEFSLNSNVSRGSKSLKTITRKYFGHETLELDDIIGTPVDGNMIKYLEPIVIKVYGCSDTDYTLQTLFKCLPMLHKYGSTTFMRDNSMIEMLARAEYMGNKLDMQLLGQLDEVNDRNLARIETIMWDFIGFYAPRIQAENYLQIYEQTNNVKIPAVDREFSLEKIRDSQEFKDNIEAMYYKKKKKHGERVPLEFSSDDDLATILFDILKYPVTRTSEKTGKPQTNTEARADLLIFKAKEPVKFLKSNVYSAITDLGFDWVAKKDTILIKREDVEEKKYPFALLLDKWKELEKLKTSFFHKLLSENTDGWYYTDYSMTSAETARVINSIQTLVGSLKRLVVPFSPNRYSLIWDANQIEFRVMIGVAIQYWKQCIARAVDKGAATLKERDITELVARLDNSEKDYHREGGAILVGTTPEEMTKEQRNEVKPVHFSVPFGANAFSIAKDAVRKAVGTAAKRKAVENTDRILQGWRKAMFPLYSFLTMIRRMATTPLPEKDLPVGLTGNWGMCQSPSGRRRYFNLEPNMKKYPDMTYDHAKKLTIAKVRRMAGNFPIQNTAREIFFSGVIKIYYALQRDGYIDEIPGNDRAVIHNFIHDEGHIDIDKDAMHPYQSYGYVADNFCVKLVDHPRYFAGISIVNNWYDGKQDEFEAPFNFVAEKAADYKANPEKFDNDTSWKSDPQQWVLEEIRSYMYSRFVQELTPYIKDSLLDLDKFLKGFKNYFLQPRLNMYSKLYREPNGDDKLSTTAIRLEYCLLKAYTASDRDSLMICYHGNLYSLTGLQELMAESDTNRSEVMISPKENAETDDAAETDAFSQLFGDVQSDSIFEDSIAENWVDTDSYSEKIAKEQAYAREYYILSDEERTQSVEMLTIDEEEDAEEDLSIPENKYIFQDAFDRWVLNVRGVKSQTYIKVIDYLKPYLSTTDGLPLIVFTTEIVNTHRRLLDGFDTQEVADIIEGRQRVSV